ncbi:MAG: tRNA (adenosine(37)-N6)-threonylcarbamoyltransferase complex dimerization subunit type 1 TsaB [Verrucomicrobiota bacterium]
MMGQMKWLTIETSTERGSVALVEGDEVLGEEVFVSERGHNAAIFEPLGRLLEGADGELGGIVVGTGPGSYGGVRVGIAVATGLSLAKAVPIFGVPSLLGADEVEGDDYVVVGDARRGSFFVAEVKGRRTAGEAELLEAAAFVERVRGLSGEGWEVVTFDGRELPVDGDVVSKRFPSAGVLGRVTAAMGGVEREKLAEEALQPIYLRAPYITEAKGVR